MANENIDTLINRLTDYGLKESTINSLYDYSNDIVEKIIFIKKIKNDDYFTIGLMMENFHETFLEGIVRFIGIYEEKNVIFSDYDVTMLADRLRQESYNHIDKIINKNNISKSNDNKLNADRNYGKDQ
jgi:hypothetical protein